MFLCGTVTFIFSATGLIFLNFVRVKNTSNQSECGLWKHHRAAAGMADFHLFASQNPALFDKSNKNDKDSDFRCLEKIGEELSNENRSVQSMVRSLLCDVLKIHGVYRL